MNTTSQISEVELELTYLAAKIPIELTGSKPERLIDIYVPDSGVDHARLRLRKKGNVFQITKKQPINEGDASAHNEMTIPLDEKEFEALSTSSTKQIVKDRYNVVINGSPAEVDVFLNDLAGLVLIDFEFASEADKQAFSPTDICLADVTQENFIAGGLLAGKTYSDIESDLEKFGYKPL